MRTESTTIFREFPDIAKCFGAVLRQRRKMLGITQITLAAKLDCDRTYISQLERGIRQPRLTVFFALASEVELKPDELLRNVMQASLSG